MCVVLRFAVFVARYLNYIEYRCCISDTLRSIQLYFIALLSKSAGKNKVIIAAGVPLFFRRAREEIEIMR